MMEPAPIDQVAQPGVLESARRHIWTLASFTVVGALLGFGLSMLQPTMYQGESHILLTPPSDSSAAEPNRVLLNQRELMTSVTVTERAAKLAGNRVSGETLRERLSTDAPADRDLVIIKVLDPTPQGAKQLADAVTRAYDQTLTQNARTTAQELTATINRLRPAVARLDRELAANPADAALRAERDALLTQIGELSGRRNQYSLGQSPSSDLTVLRETLPAPESPAQPKTILNVAIGALFGLLAGGAMAWWLSGRSATTVLTSQEAESLLGLPVLARLPVRSAKRGQRDRLVMLDGSETVEGEAFRFLRTSVTAAMRTNKASVVMVTSATEGEGKSMVAANLALAMARAGVRVGLIDLDLRRPAQRGLLELPEGPGFTEVALGKVKLERALHRLVLVDTAWGVSRRGSNEGKGPQRSEVAFVEVLTAGARPKGVGELVRYETTGDLIRQLRERVDVVLIDAPPMLRVGDALSLTAVVDALLVVARMKVVRRKALVEFRRILNTSETPLLGLVANGAATAETYTLPYGVPTKPSAAVQGEGIGNNGSSTASVVPGGQSDRR